MTKYNVQILPTAWEDLKHIENRHTIQSNFETALKITDRILASIERLELFPNFGSKLPDEWLIAIGYRMMICDEYVSIYRIIENTVYVYHIAFTRTEYSKLFTL